MRRIITLMLALWSTVTLMAQGPEILHYKFDGTGTTVTNYATNPPAGTATGTILGTGLTQGGTGVCDGALNGTGTGSTNDYVNTNWATNLTGTSWTIAFWTNNITPSGNLWYIFGDVNANGFRCFTNGVAGANNWILRGPVSDISIPGGATPAPNFNVFVYDAVAGQTRAYLNGNLVSTVTQGPPTISSAGPFKVGAYSSNLNLNGQMDEFRLYSRALTAMEISALYAAPCPPSATFDCIANTTATPDAPTLALNPANPTGSINASWPAASAPSYTLRWRPQGANGFAQRTVSTNNFSTTAFSQLLSATTYNFWVINRCSNNSADFYTSPVASLATAGPSTGCGVPAVTCGSSTESSISVEWPELSSATRIGARYSFAGQTGYSQSSSIAYATTAGTSTFTFSGLLANQTYTISLFAECEGRIWWSSPITCSTGMMSPRLANNTYTFSFEGDEYVDVKMTDFQFFAPAAGLPNHTVDVSSGQLVVSFEEAAQQAFRFGLLPNVTSDMTSLSFVTSKATDANLSVYSLNGTLVYQQALGQVQNAQRIDLNTTEFAAGVYQVVVQTNDTQYSQKLVVVK